jgi:hypothetical protein
MELHRVTIPKRMRGLRRDSRGYPEHWVLYRDETDKAHFSINDSGRVEFAKIDRLCSICGAPLFDHLHDPSASTEAALSEPKPADCDP